LPTEAELNAERLSWGSNNAAGAFASPLKLTVGGFGSGVNGSLPSIGQSGLYWSSTVDGQNARDLDFNFNSAFMDGRNRADGLSVRCVRN
jgi:hypothetical protein